MCGASPLYKLHVYTAMCGTKGYGFGLKNRVCFALWPGIGYVVSWKQFFSIKIREFEASDLGSS